MRARRGRWCSTAPMSLILILVVTFLVIARVYETRTSASWHNHCSSSTKGASVSSAAQDKDAPMLPPADQKLSTLDDVPGVSIAASVDPDFNRQLFDLSSSGTVRLRKLKGNTTSWTEPEIVLVNPRPKSNSPLAALSWRGSNGASVGNTVCCDQ